jgi:flagellar basal body-associated protein FliL
MTMAKELKSKPEPEPVVVPEETPPQPPRSYRIHILLGLVIIALAQTMFLFFMLPSQKQIAAELLKVKDDVLGDDRYKIPTDVVPMTDLQKEPLAEKPLGDKFKVQSIRQGPEQVTDVFTVTIVVQILKKDETAYDKIYAERQNTIRDAVTTVLRASSLEDRNQTSLITIKRNVKKAVNEVLGITYVQGVLCTDSSVEMI